MLKKNLLLVTISLSIGILIGYGANQSLIRDNLSISFINAGNADSILDEVDNLSQDDTIYAQDFKDIIKALREKNGESLGIATIGLNKANSNETQLLQEVSSLTAEIARLEGLINQNIQDIASLNSGSGGGAQGSTEYNFLNSFLSIYVTRSILENHYNKMSYIAYDINGLSALTLTKYSTSTSFTEMDCNNQIGTTWDFGTNTCYFTVIDIDTCGSVIGGNYDPMNSICSATKNQCYNAGYAYSPDLTPWSTPTEGCVPNIYGDALDTFALVPSLGNHCDNSVGPVVNEYGMIPPPVTLPIDGESVTCDWDSIISEGTSSGAIVVQP